MRVDVRRKGRRKLALFATLAAVFGVFLSFGAGSASAAAQCTYGGNTANISLQGDTAVVTKGNLSHINVNGVWCTGRRRRRTRPTST